MYIAILRCSSDRNCITFYDATFRLEFVDVGHLIVGPDPDIRRLEVFYELWACFMSSEVMSLIFGDGNMS